MPTTAPDIVLTPVDTAVVIDPLANDSGEGLVLDGFTQPAHGIVVANPDGTLTYTPAPGFAGVDSFTYTVRDAAGATATGTVTVSVLAPNEPPVANDDEADTAAGTAIEIPVLANDADPDGDALRLVAIGQPVHGTASFVAPDRIRYVPQPGFSGIDRFGYTIDDGNGGVATGSVTVRVAGANRDPVAADVEVETTDGTPLTLDLLARASDPDGDPLRLEALGVPQHGRITVNSDRTVTYTPQSGWSGTDSFTWTVGDGRGGLATGRVRVRVVRPNLPPAANDDTLTTPQDTPLVFDPLAHASDPDGDPLRLAGFSLPRHGRLALDADGRLVYTPDPGFSGEDGFTWTIDDGRGGVATGTVRITVTPAEPPAEVFANGFRFRRRILLPARQQAPEVIEGFVLLVKEEGDWLKSVANGGRIESPDGFDLRFELDDGRKLAHEIERYDPQAGSLVAWVRIPSWDIATTLTLFLYYGKTGLTASEADPAATWQDHLAVWDPVTGRDRSGRGRDLVATGLVPDELVGPAGRFDGAADLRRADASFLNGLAALNLTAVVRADPAIVGQQRPARIIQQGSPGASAGDAGLVLTHAHPGFFGGAPSTLKFALMTSGGSVQLEGAPDLQRATPMVIGASWRSGELPKLHIDGREVLPSWVGVHPPGSEARQNVAVTGTTAIPAGQPLSIGLGALKPDRSWIGTIGELRLRATVPSQALSALEADNILAPWRVLATGSEERPGMGDFPPVVGSVEVTTRAGRSVDIDVLAAAFDPENLPLTVEAVGAPAHGVASVVGSLVRYAPLAGFTGHDSFSFTLRDAAGATGTGTVRIRVDGIRTGEPALPEPRRTILVGSAGELTAALAGARPGDHIVLLDGTYEGPFTCSTSGTNEDPIVLRAANKLGAKLTGGGLQISANHVWVWGLDCLNSTNSWFLRITGDHDHVLRCRFNMFGTAIRLLNGRGARILFCEFTCPSKDAQSPSNETIFTNKKSGVDDHVGAEIGLCWFHDMPFKTDQYHDRVREAIAIGNNHDDRSKITNHWIHHCLLENTGDCELSIKTRGNLVEYCTAIGDQASVMRHRYGGDNIFRGCWNENGRHAEIMDGPVLLHGCRTVGCRFDIMAGTPDETLFPHARNVTLAWCDGTVTVGKQWNARMTEPATGTRIEAHTGNIQHGPETGTVITGTSVHSRVTPVRLTRADVGV